MAGSVGPENPIQRLVRGFRDHPVTEAVGRYTSTTRHASKRAKARALDIGHPVVVLARGTRRMAADARTYWTEAGGHERHKEWRDLVVFVFAVCAVAVGFQPYGVLLLIAVWAAAATYLGRDRPDPGKDPESEAHVARLQSAYNGLVPYLMDTHDPDERFKPGGGYRDGFTEWEFDEGDRLVSLKLQYSPFFKDGEADSRAKVERALEGKIGQSNEYLYDWDEEGNKLAVRILPPLPIGIPAQPWKVAEIEYVLGFTDPTSTARLIPVQLSAEPGGEVPVVELAPVVWRHGRFAAEPHLLVAGVLGSGKSNLLRSLAAQALGHGHLVTAIDAEHTGHFDEFTGRDGVLRVESQPAAAMDLLDWVCAESARRAERLRELGDTEDTLMTRLAKPLWLFVDELASLGEAAGRAGLADPQDLLADLMRAGRTTGVTVVVSCRAERVSELRATVRNQAHARVGLGQLPPGASTALFGGTLEIGGPAVLPPGRGFARVGGGPVVRVQVPVAADVTAALPVLVGAVVAAGDGADSAAGEAEGADGFGGFDEFDGFDGFGGNDGFDGNGGNGGNGGEGPDHY